MINKTDGLDLQLALADFFRLGFGDPIPIAASQKRGISKLADLFLANFGENC